MRNYVERDILYAIIDIYRSYIRYECEKAIESGIKIIVLYKSTKVDKSKCPEVVKNIGMHIAMIYYEDGKYYWDY